MVKQLIAAFDYLKHDFWGRVNVSLGSSTGMKVQNSNVH